MYSQFSKKTFQDTSELPLQNGCQFPSAASSVSMATVTSAVTMTTCDAVKKAMSVRLDISVSDSFISSPEPKAQR